MIWLIAVIGLLVICFGGVLLFGAPYLPTLNPQVKIALDLAGLKPGQTMLELGCGDGKMLIAAAQQGIKVVGYELNPLLALVAWLRTRRYRGQVRVICGDFWHADWPPAEAIFTFLLPRYMAKLDARIKSYQDQQQRPVTLISFAFRIPDKQPKAEKQGVLRYDYR